MLATVLLLLGAIAAAVAAISIHGDPGSLWQALTVVSIAQLVIAGALVRRVRFASGIAVLALIGHAVLIVGTTLLFLAFGAFGAGFSAYRGSGRFDLMSFVLISAAGVAAVVVYVIAIRSARERTGPARQSG